MLSNRLLESYEGRRLYNESINIDIEASGNGNSYVSIDDEDEVGFCEKNDCR